MDNKIKKKIEKFVEEFVEKATFNATFEVRDSREGNFLVELKTDEPETLIGEGGQTLWDMQALFNRIFRKALGETGPKIELDINQYKQGKARYLKEMAQEIANRVALFKKEERLPAMSSYERRVVHMELSIRTDVGTESIGEGDARRIVVKPAVK